MTSQFSWAILPSGFCLTGWKLAGQTNTCGRGKPKHAIYTNFTFPHKRKTKTKQDRNPLLFSQTFQGEAPSAKNWIRAAPFFCFPLSDKRVYSSCYKWEFTVNFLISRKWSIKKTLPQADLLFSGFYMASPFISGKWTQGTPLIWAHKVLSIYIQQKSAVPYGWNGRTRK